MGKFQHQPFRHAKANTISNAKLKTSNIYYHRKRIVTRTIYYLENFNYLKEKFFAEKKLLILS